MRLIDADKLDWWYKSRPIRRVIDEAPTVDAVEVVHGKWLDVFSGFSLFAATCSVCNKRSDLPPIAVAKYCPRCGAKMDGENNEHS